jgi:eight-cysteine-cluster-containing protein
MDQNLQTPSPQTTQPVSPQTPAPPPPPPTSMDNLPNTTPPPRHIPKSAVIIFSLMLLIILGLGGFNLYKNFANQNTTITPTPSIHVQASPTSTPNFTADWKTYKSTRSGFSMRYPSNWIEDTTTTDYEIYAYTPHPGGSGLDGMSIRIMENPRSLPLEEFLKQEKNNQFSSNNFIKETSTLGIPLEWMIDRNAPGAGGGQETLIAHGTKVIVFYCGNCNDQLTNQILSSFTDEQNLQSSSECKPGGCSGQVCEDASAEPIYTTCEYKAEYACYKTATCERQADGKCGWTQTSELTSCLENAKDAPVAL